MCYRYYIISIVEYYGTTGILIVRVSIPRVPGTGYRYSIARDRARGAPATSPDITEYRINVRAELGCGAAGGRGSYVQADPIRVVGIVGVVGVVGEAGTERQQ